MVKVISGLTPDGKPCEFYLDGKLKDTLDKRKDWNRRQWDTLSIIVGFSGAGKSTFVRTACKYLDPNFSVDNIVFSGEEFVKKTQELPEFSAIVLDESFDSMNSKLSQSKDFRVILEQLQIVRARKLYMFLCLPNFFDLNKSVSLFRAEHLFVITATKEGERGYFRAYGRNRKQELHEKGKKYLNHLAVKANFRGRFTKGTQCIDVTEYERRKLLHVKTRIKKINEEGDGKVRSKREWELKTALIKLNFDGLVTRKRLAQIIGRSEATLVDWEKDFKRRVPEYTDKRPRGFNKRFYPEEQDD